MSFELCQHKWGKDLTRPMNLIRSFLWSFVFHNFVLIVTEMSVLPFKIFELYTLQNTSTFMLQVCRLVTNFSREGELQTKKVQDLPKSENFTEKNMKISQKTCTFYIRKIKCYRKKCKIYRRNAKHTEKVLKDQGL